MRRPLALRFVVVLVALWSMPTAQAEPQNLVLWAWTTDTDLRTVASELPITGIAYLAGEIRIGRGGTTVARRVRPLRLPRGVERTAVVFVHVQRGHPPPLDDASLAATVERIRNLPLVRDAARVQLDFEATASQRRYWQRLVMALRANLPSRQALDVAVLVSWCLEGDFAVPEAERIVPMLYRLGRRDAALRDVLAGKGEFAASTCHRAVGVATDELDRIAPWPHASRQQIYAFAPGGWRAEAVTALRSWLALDGTVSVRPGSSRWPRGGIAR